jgi:tetrachlorobenzoquinone reductase
VTSNTTPQIQVRLTAVRYEARDINTYELTPTAGADLPDAEPGAHIDLHLPGGLERQYSLIEYAPSPKRYLVAVKRDPESRGGSALIHERLRVGDILSISPPRNNFPLVEAAAETVLIAGGIGVTPIWCMAQKLAALGRPFTLHYACRAREEAAFLAEIEATGRARVHFDAQAGGPPDVTAILAAAPRQAHLYCCGPGPMLAAFEAAAADWPAGQVHLEYFTPKYERDLSGGYVVELARSGLTLPVPAGKTILQVLREAGLEVETSCEEGVCGSCETRVLAGEPDHRDAILSPEERAEGKTMFICCSGARSERLVLDR